VLDGFGQQRISDKIRMDVKYPSVFLYFFVFVGNRDAKGKVRMVQILVATLNNPKFELNLLLISRKVLSNTTGQIAKFTFSVMAGVTAVTV
jgi:hypothetical protein